MPRGGARSGAGRKPTLSFLEKVAIGSHCQQLWREESDQKLNAVLDAKYETANLEWRKALDARAHGEPLSCYHADDVEFALEDDHRRASWRKPVRRPKGKAQAIAKRVATIETAKRGKKVSLRMVETCWDLFRATEKKLIADAGHLPTDGRAIASVNRKS
jgi:hypothetical protein